MVITVPCHGTVRSSILRVSAIYADVAQLVEQSFCKAKVGGSTPLIGPIIKKERILYLSFLLNS